MRLITKVAIRNFRSILFETFESGDMTAFIGGNGSGKSNVFRALNAFFNGVLEPGAYPDLSRDFHRPWRSTRNRFMEVDVHFQLPAEFSIRREIADALGTVAIAPGASFAVRKRWSRDAVRDDAVAETYFFSPEGDPTFTGLTTDQARAVARFLQLVKFRYVPNHIHPSELLRAENSALQEELLRALRRELRRSATQVNFDALLTTMSSAAKDLVEPISSVLQDSPGRVEALEVTTPGDWAEVVWSLALKLRAGGPRALDVGLHGSGNQSFLMYVVLHFLDTRFSQEFGWHQATVWALEEPESFLHANLKNRLAAFLMTSTESPRFQTFLTTHELLFASTANVRHEVALDEEQTRITRREVIELSERTLASGVTPFIHPCHSRPRSPRSSLMGRSMSCTCSRPTQEVAGRIRGTSARSSNWIPSLAGLGGTI